jgi:hypothetical protein
MKRKLLTFAEYSPEAHLIDGLALADATEVKASVYRLRLRREYAHKIPSLDRPRTAAANERAEYMRYCQLFDAAHKIRNAGVSLRFDAHFARMGNGALKVAMALGNRGILRLDQALTVRRCSIELEPGIARGSIDKFDAYFIGLAQDCQNQNGGGI